VHSARNLPKCDDSNELKRVSTALFDFYGSVALSMLTPVAFSGTFRKTCWKNSGTDFGG
jgi:hypothetical protein